MVAVVVLSIIDIDSQILVMASLLTSPGTLRTQAVADPGEQKTIISRWIDAITTEVASGNVKTVGGNRGPTISARFYSLVGTAAYEAFQATQKKVKSTVNNYRKAKIPLLNYQTEVGSEFQEVDLVSDLISATILKVATNKISGLTDKGILNLKAFETSVLSASKDSDYWDKSDIEKISSEIAQKVVKAYANDGYNAPEDYTSANSLDNIILIDKWTPEYNQSDIPASGIQSYLTPQWGKVTPFGISSDKLASITSNAANPHSFLLDTNNKYNLKSGTITDIVSGEVYEINKSLIGSYINPDFIEQANKVIEFSQALSNTPQGAIKKATAEFWEDGAGTPFPPGTWMVLGQALSLENNYGLQQDAELFLGLGATVHAAAISAWDLKLQDNYARPIRAIRNLSSFGLLRDEDPNTPGSQFRAFNRSTGTVDLISGIQFETYQLPNGGYSPPFAEYTSGHSTFSSSSAEFLTKFSGKKEFPWDINFTLTFPFTNSLGKNVTLEYESLSEAAVAAGDSRLWGGIHFNDGNDNGLLIGKQIGAEIYDIFSSL